MRSRFAFIAILIFLLVVQLPTIAFAVDPNAITFHISDLNSQIESLNKEIANYQSQIADTNAQSNTLANIIKELTLTRDKLLAQVNQTQKKISATNIIINNLDSDITDKENKITVSSAALNQMIRDLNLRDNTSMLEKILSEQNLADASREYNNIVTVNEKVRTLIVDLGNQKANLEQSKTKKETEQQQLSKLKQNLVNQKTAVDIAKSEKNTLLKETKNKESNYKKLLADRLAKRDLFEKSLQNYEAQLQFVLHPELLPKEGSGVLAWPIDSVFITQLFGVTSSSKRLYKSGSHSGVDFRASIGTEVKSMADGTVIGTGDTDVYCRGASFGKWVFIKYDSGLSSTFGHLSYIKAQVGQRVNTGDVVALSGNTGHSTGPHLHVTVYASEGASVRQVPSLTCNGKNFVMPIAPVDAYLDPMLYLPYAPESMIKNDLPRD